jgi:glutamyl-tRNA reductase
MTTAGLGGLGRAQLRDMAAASLVAALHARAEDIRRGELSRAEGQWEALTPDDRRRVEILTECLVGALLGEPTARLQSATAQDAPDLESARYLFGLEPQGEHRVRVPRGG